MTKKELRKISLEFRTLSSQMLRIDSQEEIVYMQAFYNFINNEDFIHKYIISCHTNDYDFEECFKNLRYHEKLVLPVDQKELIDYEYQLMNYILNEKRQLYAYGQHYTSSNHFTDMISSFMRKVIEPFVVALRTYLEISLIDANDLELEIIPITKTIFLSYCQKDSDIADIIDDAIGEQVKGKAKISRDIRDVDFHQSFKAFMQSIEQHDYVITVISNNYLKSRNCMYEMLEVVKDSNFGKKLIYIVLSDEDIKYYKTTPVESVGADVYNVSGQTKYSLYWKKTEEELQKQIEDIGDPTLSITQIKEKRIVHKILLDISEFMEFIRDRNGFTLTKHIDNNFSDIIRFMNL